MMHTVNIHFDFSEHDSGTLFDYEEVKIRRSLKNRLSAQWVAMRLLLHFILLALFLLTKSKITERILWFHSSNDNLFYLAYP